MTMSDQNGNCAYEYTVKRGDSFYLIAQRTGVTLRELIAANPNIPPSRLTIGDVLCIPYSECLNQPAQEPGGNPVIDPDNNIIMDNNGVCPLNRRAVVQQGQTAADLQVKYNLSYYTLQMANAGMDLDAIKAGDTVCIPEENIACPVDPTVTLTENDSLTSIALTNRVTVADVLKVNPCIPPNNFVAGVTVKLPDLPQVNNP